MLLISKPPTSKDLVKFEGIKGSAIFTRGRCVAWSDFRNIVCICMYLADHGFGSRNNSVG